MRHDILVFIVLAILISGCVQQKGDVMNLTGKNVLIIIAHNGFRDEEFEQPYNLLSQAGADVTVASSDTTTTRGILGKTVQPDIRIDRVQVENYDAIIFVGGVGAKEYFNNKTTLSIAKQGYEQGRIIGAICIAPSILANAGILDGKKATSFSSESENLESHGAIYTGSDVEVDGNIITADGPQSANKFGKEIGKALVK